MRNLKLSDFIRKSSINVWRDVSPTISRRTSAPAPASAQQANDSTDVPVHMVVDGEAASRRTTSRSGADD